MSIALIIYLASIAENVTGVLIIFAFLSGFTAAGVALAHDKEKREKLPKGLLSTLLLLLVFCSFTAAIIPSEEAIYKIAGVTEQQKAKINATGAVVEPKHQAEAQ